jgi:hypothetical protein
VAMVGKKENKMGYPHHSSFEKKILFYKKIQQR